MNESTVNEKDIVAVIAFLQNLTAAGMSPEDRAREGYAYALSLIRFRSYRSAFHLGAFQGDFEAYPMLPRDQSQAAEALAKATERFPSQER